MNYMIVARILDHIAKKKLKPIQKQWIKKRYPGFLEWIEKKEGGSLKEKIYRLANQNVNDTCIVCGKKKTKRN